MHMVQMIPLKSQFYEPKQRRITIRPDSCCTKMNKPLLNSVELHLIFKLSHTKKRYNELKCLCKFH